MTCHLKQPRSREMGEQLRGTLMELKVGVLVGSIWLQVSLASWHGFDECWLWLKDEIICSIYSYYLFASLVTKWVMILHRARSRDNVTVGEEYVTVIVASFFLPPLNEFSTVKKSASHITWRNHFHTAEGWAEPFCFTVQTQLRQQQLNTIAYTHAQCFQQPEKSMAFQEATQGSAMLS